MKVKSGFTLVELIIVIAMVGILATLVVVAFNSSRLKARDSQRVHDIKEIRTALELYYNRYQSYPSSLAPGFTFAVSNTVYLDPMPSNPTPRTDGSCYNENYVYSPVANNTSYTLSFCLGGDTGTITAGAKICTSTSCAGTFSYDPAADALFTRFSVTPSDADKHYMNNLIVSGKAHGWWDKLDIFYVFAIGTNATDSRLNWKSTLNNAIPGVAPTWTAYQGITGNGSTQYLTTTYNPTTEGVNYISGSQSMGIYSRTDANGGYVEIGGFDGGCSAPFIRSGGATLNYMASCSATSYTNPNSLGFFIAQRTSTTTNKLYKNGTLVQTDSITSSSVLNTDIYIGARNNGGSPVAFSPRQIAVAFAGGALSDTEASLFSADVNEYMKSVGTNVY